MQIPAPIRTPACGVVGVGDAKRVFEGMGEGRDVVSWNTMIGGLVKANRLSDARALFDEMPVRDMLALTGYSKARGDMDMTKDVV
ncbi:pentatricopeptide repeat-containing protein [Tanacetum coccineum]